jgi:cholestenol Delta-isomerase
MGASTSSHSTRHVRGSEIGSIADSLARMDLQGMVFSEASARYDYHASDVLDKAAVWRQEDRMQSLADAASRLFDIMSRVLVLIGRESEEELPKEAQLKEDMKVWEEQMRSFMTKHPTPRQTAAADARDNADALLSVKLYHVLIHGALRAGTIGTEMRWDSVLPEFERMVMICATLLDRATAQGFAPANLSLDMGVIVPLYIVATRCRHPVVRRQALTLLQRANRQEGMLPSNLAGKMAATIVTIEEEAMGNDAGVMIYLDPIEVRAWAEELVSESSMGWLDSNTWRSRASWEGITRIPLEGRVDATSIAADTDNGVLDVTLEYGRDVRSGAPRMRNVLVTF